VITGNDELIKGNDSLSLDHELQGVVWPIYLGSILTGLISFMGIAIAIISMQEPLGPVKIYSGIPFIHLTLGTDFLSSIFLLITGVVALFVALFSIGYFKAHKSPSLVPLLIPFFILSMLGVITASDVFSFLWMWELMALISIGGILADYRRREVREAGVFYSIMTHLGFLAILVALTFLATTTGASSFHHLKVLASGLSTGEKTFIFLFSLIGFGSKAGLVPLHAWLPKAHPEAPSPNSALFSAVMVNLGIYGIIRIDIQILGPGPMWWGILLLGLGAASALNGALQASVSIDLKRLLAYSTIENMGIISMALGLGMIMESTGAPQVALIAFTAAIIHLFNH
jgi:hydrogenase-4 component B